jgi:hypothetical protein
MMRKVFSAVCVFFAIFAAKPECSWSETGGNTPVAAGDLAHTVHAPDFWKGDAAAVQARFSGTPFRWVSQEKKELRAAHVPMTYLGLPVVEVVVRLKGAVPGEVFLSVYNRGDLGRLTDVEFESLLTKTIEAVDTRLGVKGEDLGDALKRRGLRAQSRGWVGVEGACRLDAAYSRVREEGERGDRPEFINLTLYPAGTAKEGMLTQRMAELKAADLPQRVQRLESGDVVLDSVPMVDQGQKGYCAVATMERILRYYGSEVNQHELAQQANSSGEGGTDPESLVKALKSMGSKLGLRVNERESFDARDFFDLLDDYDKAAKRKKKPQLVLSRSGVIDVGVVYASMDVEVLRDVKLKRESRVEKFFKETTEAIDQGQPLAWGVQLGWVEEKPRLPQGGGGHMRLIIGYNPAKKEILYSDSWGLGHELKRMSLQDAYLITTGLYVVEPRS